MAAANISFDNTDLDIGALAAAMVPQSMSVADIIKSHPELVADLRAHKLAPTVARVSGLLTVPGLHANTIRLEMLIHLAAACCAADDGRRPRSKQLDKWLNKELAEIAWAEDPVEDVFVASVTTGLGNHRVFEGIWERADFSTQRIVEAIDRIPAEPHGTHLRSPVGALFKLSELLAARANVARNVVGGGNAQGRIVLPSDERVYALGRRVVFKRQELENAGIDPRALDPFVLPADRAPIANEGVGDSSLERRPLIEDGDEFVIALPTAVSTAIRHFVVRECTHRGLVDVLEDRLRERSQDLLQTGLSMLHATPADMSPVEQPDGLPIFDEYLYRFDANRYAHVVLLHDSVRDMAQNGFAVPGFCTLEEAKKLDKYTEAVASQIGGLPGFADGMTLVVAAGLGRGIHIGFGERPDRWLITSFSLFDLHILGQLRHASLALVWKLRAQRESLRKAELEIPAFNGDINLLAYWWHQKWSLVPDDFPYGQGHCMISVTPDTVVLLRKEIRTKYDEHGAPLPSGSLVRVHRRGHEHYFSALANQPLFVSPEHAKAGELFGVVETRGRFYWIAIADAPALAHRELAYRIWDATTNWMTRLAPYLGKTLPEGGALLVRIDVSALGSAEISDEAVVKLKPEVPIFAVIDPTNVTVAIPEGWRLLIREPTNVGEKVLMEAVLKGITQATGALWSSTLQARLDDAFRDTGARFLHVFAASGFRDYERTFLSDRARLIPPEDIEWTRLGIAWLAVAPPEPQRVEGQTECAKLLHKVVDKLWERIKVRLAVLDRLSVITECMGRIERCALDARAWKISMRALLALHGDQLFGVSRQQELDRNRTTQACRILIEMAACEAAVNGGIPTGDIELDEILADVSELVQLAYHSDAIHDGYGRAQIDVSRSGRVHVDTAFYTNVVDPYMVEHFDDQVRKAVDSYEQQLVRDAAHDSGEEATPPDETWASAFEEEYGLRPTKFGWVLGALEQDAYKSSAPVVLKTVAELEAVIVAEAECTVQAAKKFLGRLTLPARAKWNATPPEFNAFDWYPWRFQRRLSVISRPIVQIDLVARVTRTEGTVFSA